MNRYELALIAGISTAFIGFFVFTEYLLGAEKPTGFRAQPVPIFCGPAAKLRDQLLESKSRPVFTGSAFNGAFMIFQSPPPSSAFMVTFWRDGSGSIVAAGTNAQVHQTIQWTLREKDGSKGSN